MFLIKYGSRYISSNVLGEIEILWDQVRIVENNGNIIVLHEFLPLSKKDADRANFILDAVAMAIANRAAREEVTISPQKEQRQWWEYEWTTYSIPATETDEIINLEEIIEAAKEDFEELEKEQGSQ